MFDIPWGESQTGEAFVHPIVATLRPQILRECPALTPVRYEIRLICSATGKFCSLILPADPMKTKKKGGYSPIVGCRWSSSGEKEAIVATKDPGAGGTWCPQEAEVVSP